MGKDGAHVDGLWGVGAQVKGSEVEGAEAYGPVEWNEVKRPTSRGLRLRDRR